MRPRRDRHDDHAHRHESGSVQLALTHWRMKSGTHEAPLPVVLLVTVPRYGVDSCERVYALASAKRSGKDPAGDSDIPEAAGPAGDSDAAERSRGPSRLARTMAFAQRGFTATVGVLVLLGAVVTAYAFWVRPHTAIPNPPWSQALITFGPGHSATSPLTVTIWMGSEYPSENHGHGIELDIDLAGSDLAHPGWSILMIVPTGVRLVPDYLILDNPSKEYVTPHGWSTTQDTVVLKPGPQKGQKYSAILTWDNLHSGPMQINGPNLTASIPDVEVDNQASGNNNGARPVPTPQLTVTRELYPAGDFTYIGGQPPDQIDKNSNWSWKATAPNLVNGGGGVLSRGPYVEARSAFMDEQSGDALFKSGIAFGVAASALIAAIQEFVNSAANGRRRPQRKAHGEPSQEED